MACLFIRLFWKNLSKDFKGGLLIIIVFLLIILSFYYIGYMLCANEFGGSIFYMLLSYQIFCTDGTISLFFYGAAFIFLLVVFVGITIIIIALIVGILYGVFYQLPKYLISICKITNEQYHRVDV